MKRWKQNLSCLALHFGIVTLATLASAAYAAEGGPCLREGDPREVGMDPAVLAQIGPAMERFVEAKEISGSVTMVVRKG
ncbi:MAG: hypothetical protein GYA33_08670, partial [Thermogutta sp.]|nr:hypothetical protein [Thermogutta sp.]